jgi:hypothetical protein
VQRGGLDAYAGIYNWNIGNPELMLFKRSGGNWTQLGNSYSSGPLAAGTQLKVMAVGSKILFLENGVQRLSVSDSSFFGGAPGIMVYGDGKAGNWSAADVSGYAPFQVQYVRTGADGVKWYQVISQITGPSHKCCASWLPRTPHPRCLTISYMCSRFSLDWATPSRTGWKLSANSMRKTGTT